MTVRHGVGDALVEAGELTVRRLGRASTWRREHGGTIERALLSTGAVSEEVLTSALSREYGLPGALRDELAAADPDLVDSLAAKERRRLRALPFRHEGKVLHVAVTDPRNPVLSRVLEADSGFTIALHAPAGTPRGTNHRSRRNGFAAHGCEESPAASWTAAGSG